MASMTSLFRTAPLFIAIGGTAELCFLAWLLIKAVNAPRTRQASSRHRHRGTSRQPALVAAPAVRVRCRRSESPLPGKCAGE
jgi:hypothetical protein